MSRSDGEDIEPRLSPEEAFSVLGNETRLDILRQLGQAGGPVPFSVLYRGSTVESSANFSYHLGQLNGHFIDQTEDGYVIRQAGRRVVEAVQAEAVPEAKIIERTTVNWPCFFCGAAVEVSYRHGHVGLYCPSCGGTRDDRSTTGDGRLVDRSDVLGILDLPPAGTVGRTALEVVENADYWTTLEALALARKMCPRCSASLDVSISACSEHTSSEQPCQHCGQRFAITVKYDCQNCIFNIESPVGTYLFDNPNLHAFMLAHGIDPFDSSGFHFHALEESVLNTDPLAAELTYSIKVDSIRFEMDDDLEVTLVSDNETAEFD